MQEVFYAYDENGYIGIVVATAQCFATIGLTAGDL